MSGFRNITVFIKADATALRRGLGLAAGHVNKFSGSVAKATTATRGMTREQQMSAKATNTMARFQGHAVGQLNRNSGALRRGEESTRKMADATGLLNKVMTGFKSVMMQAGAALVGFLAINAAIRVVMGSVKASVEAWRSFDAAMVESLAIMGDVSDHMRTEMSNAAREMAKTSTFAANEVAEAYFFLASAGIDAENSVALLDQTVRFAQAGAFDLQKATDLLTDSQSALGMAARDSAGNMLDTWEDATGVTRTFAGEYERVSDVLVGANTLANASVEQFATALTTKAATAARQAGIEIEEVVAVLAVFADQGIKGQLAGNAFNMVLRDLTTKAISNADAFERMNINVFDASGNFAGFPSIIGEIETAFDGMSDKMIRSSLIQLGFTDRSVAAMSALIGMGSQIGNVVEEFEDMAGITQQVADKQLEAFDAKLEVIKSQLLDIAIGAGMAFNDWLNKIGKSDAFKSVVDGVKAVAQALEPTVKVVGVLAGAFLKLIETVAMISWGAQGEMLSRFATAANLLAAVITTKLVVALWAKISATRIGIATIGAYKVQLAQAGLEKYRLALAGQNLTHKVGAVTVATNRASAALAAMRAQLAAVAAGGKGAIAAAGGLGGAFSKLGGIIRASLGVIAITAIMNIGSAMKQARGEAQALISEISEGADMSSLEGIEDHYNNLRDSAEEAGVKFNDMSNIRMDDLGGSVRNVGNAIAYGTGSLLGFSTAGHKAKAEAEELEKEVRKVQRQFLTARGNIDVFSERLGVSDSVIETAARSLGVDLTQGIERGSESWKKMISHVESGSVAIMTAGLDIEDFGDDLGEAFEAAASHSEEMAEKINGAMHSMVSSAAAYEAALVEIPTLMDAFGASADRLEEDFKRSVDAQNKAASDTVSSLRDQASAESRARAEMLRNLDKDNEAEVAAFEAQTEAIERSWEERIKAAEEGAKGLSDTLSQGAARMPNFAEVMAEAQQQQQAASAFTELLNDIVREGFEEFDEPQMRLNVLNMVEFLRELGPEQGGELAESILGNMRELVNEYNTELEGLGKGVAFNVQEYLNDLVRQHAEFVDTMDSITTIMLTPQVTMTPEQVSRILDSDHPEAINAIADLINQGDLVGAQIMAIAEAGVEGLSDIDNQIWTEFVFALGEGDFQRAEELMELHGRELNIAAQTSGITLSERFSQIGLDNLNEFDAIARASLDRMVEKIEEFEIDTETFIEATEELEKQEQTALRIEAIFARIASINRMIFGGSSDDGADGVAGLQHPSWVTKMYPNMPDRELPSWARKGTPRSANPGGGHPSGTFDTELNTKSKHSSAQQPPTIVRLGESRHTNYNFGDVHASDSADVLRFAQQKKRTSQLASATRG